MAYSNDKVWPSTAWTSDLIIERALRILGEYDEGDSIPTGEMTTARLALNGMIREWAATDGIGLWLRKRCVLIVDGGVSNGEGIQQYRLGPPGGVTGYFNPVPGAPADFHWAYEDELVEGVTNADEAALQTVISVDDSAWVNYSGQLAAKPSAGDVIGILDDTNTINWDTVLSVAAGTITLTTALLNAASSGSKIFAYTNRAPRPHGIVSIGRESNSGSYASIELIGRKDYDLLSLKSSDGPVTRAHFDPGLNATDPDLDYATLHVWPVSPGRDWLKVVATAEFFPDIVDGTASENIQFPNEWAGALAYNLANELADEYEIDLRRIQRIHGMAQEKYDNLAWSADREEASFWMARDVHGQV